VQVVINAQEESVIDQKGNIIKIRNNIVTTAATAPATPLQNDIWFDTTAEVTKVYDGSVWLTINLDALAKKEDTANKSTDTNLSDATNTKFPTELAVKTYVDSKLVAPVDDDITAVSFDGTDLTVDEGLTSFSADLSGLRDSDWFQSNTTIPATSINQDIYTLGNVGIGTNDPQRGLHVAGGNSVIRLSRSSNTAAMIFDRYSGTVDNTLKSFQFGLNASALGVGEFFFADYNEQIGGAGFTRIMTFTDGNEVIRFNQYGAGNFTSTTSSYLLGVESDGDLVEVDPSTFGTNTNIYNTDGTLTANRAVTQNNFDLNFDANTLVVSGNNDRVGIGTTAPDTKLHVSTTSGTGLLVESTAGNFIEMKTATGLNNHFYFSDATNGIRANIINNRVGSDNVLRLNAGSSSTDVDIVVRNNNVGIGTLSPDQPLDVIGNIETTGTIRINSGDGDKILMTNAGINGSKISHTSGWSMNYNAGPGTGALTGSHNFTTTSGGAYTSALYIANAGNVGIGTVTPDAKLDVEGGTVRFSDYGGDAITGTLNRLLGIEADGDIIEVDPSSLDMDTTIYDTNGILTGNRAVTQNSFDLNFDANTLVVKGNTDRVGIGTNNPANTLEVEGNYTIDALHGVISSYDHPTNGIGHRYTHDSSGSVATLTANSSGYNMGSSNNIVLTPTNNVGVGITNPSAKLDVNGTMRIRTLAAGAVSDQVVTADANGNLRKLPITSLETKTSIAQNTSTGVVTHTSEDGSSQAVSIVSTNASNSISSGTDGGAYYESPTKAYGKLIPASNSIAAAGISGAVKNAVGRFTFTMATTRSSANYPIQLTLLETGTNDVKIYVTAQTATSFSIAIVQTTLGSGSYVDRTCYFTVLDF